MAPVRERPKGAEPHLELGARIRRWREVLGWNQQTLADRAGFARSTLSKIENGLLSPTFELLLKLSQGFDCEVTDIVGRDTPFLAGRLTIDRGTASEAIRTPNTRLWPLGTALRGRKFQSMLVEFTQTEIADFGPWNQHATDDMLFVLSGALILHSAGYEPTILGAGDAVHFDGLMPHACLSSGPEPCRCLYIFSPRGGGLRPAHPSSLP